MIRLALFILVIFVVTSSGATPVPVAWPRAFMQLRPPRSLYNETAFLQAVVATSQMPTTSTVLVERRKDLDTGRFFFVTDDNNVEHRMEVTVAFVDCLEAECRAYVLRLVSSPADLNATSGKFILSGRWNEDGSPHDNGFFPEWFVIAVAPMYVVIFGAAILAYYKCRRVPTEPVPRPFTRMDSFKVRQEFVEEELPDADEEPEKVFEAVPTVQQFQDGSVQDTLSSELENWLSQSGNGGMEMRVDRHSIEAQLL